MEQITITLTAEETQRIANALNLQAVNFSSQSETVGVDCMHPDFFHREWDTTTALWCKIIRALHPETDNEQ